MSGTPFGRPHHPHPSTDVRGRCSGAGSAPVRRVMIDYIDYTAIP
ncbi:hypothetical protein [Streptomyces alkaliterrae]|nr:hypothetical protein [Streptomyces alkaliterrae]